MKEHLAANTLLAKKGEHWFIKIRGSQALSKVYIVEVTPKTVSFRHNWYSSSASTYERKEIKFVEKTRE